MVFQELLGLRAHAASGRRIPPALPRVSEAGLTPEKSGKRTRPNAALRSVFVSLLLTLALLVPALRAFAAFTLKVNFQPATGVVTPPGYLPDSSGAYAANPATGYSYGWSAADTNAFSRVPDAVANVAPYNTVPYTSVVVAGTRTWEIALPNGAYSVRAVAGDASGANLGLYECNAEGVPFFSTTLTAATAAGHFADVTGTVNVADGKLSLGLPTGSAGILHFAFLEIAGSLAASDAITPSTVITPSTPAALANSDKPASWVEATQPTSEGAGSGADGSASEGHEVNVASGVYAHDHGADIGVRNPVGPAVGFGVSYRTAVAQFGFRGVTGTTLFASPGLPAGWTHGYDVHIEATNNAGWNPLRVFYPSGLVEDLSVPLSGSTPTGRLTPPTGAAYAVVGVPSGTTGKWTSLTFIKGDESRLTFVPAVAGGDLYRLSTVENLLGQAVQLSYDTFSRVSQIANVPNNANNSDNRVLFTPGWPVGTATPASFSATDFYGRVVRYTVTGGQLSNISNIGNTKDIWTFGYTTPAGLSIPLLSTVSRPRPDGVNSAIVSSVVYNDDGTVWYIADANGNKEAYSYDPSANQTVVTTLDAGSGKTRAIQTQKFDPAKQNHLTGGLDALGNLSTVSYLDPTIAVAPNKAVNPNGQQGTLTYDAFGNVLTAVSPSGQDGPLGLSTLTTTTAFLTDTAPPATLRFPLGRVGSVNLSQTGQPTSPKTVIYTYYPSGLVNTVTAPAPSGSGASTVATTYNYTPTTLGSLVFGNVASVVMPGPNTTGATVTYTYEYKNDPFAADPVSGGAEALGEPILITDPLGHAVHIRYDARGRAVRHYDALGNRTDFAYNDGDQVTQVTMPPTTTGATPPRAYTVYTYAYIGGPLLKTDLFSEANVLVRTINANKGLDGEAVSTTGNTVNVSVAYDGAYQVGALADGKGNTSGASYNNRGDVLATNYPGNTGTATSFDRTQFTGYDPAGNLKSLINGRGNAVTMNRIGTSGSTFNGSPTANNNLIKSVLYGGFAGRDIGMTYDVFGRVTGRTDGAGSYAYTYGNLDEVITVATTYKEINTGGALTGLNLPAQTFTYAYNQNGSLLSKTIANGATTFGKFAYFYDNAGRVTTINPPWSVTGGAPNIGGKFTYLYDDADRMIQQKLTFRGTVPNVTSADITTTYGYNGRDQMTGLLNTLTSNSSVDGLKTWGYGWSAIAYDAVGNRTQATVRGDEVRRTDTNARTIPNTGGTAAWTYDNNDRLIGESRSNGIGLTELGWDYTTAGHVYDNAYNPTKLRNQPVTLGYNINSQLTGTGYGYDGDGNAIAYASGALGYDEESRLSDLTPTGLSAPSYRAGYRGDGMRAWRTANAALSNRVTYFLYDELTGQLQYELEPSGAAYVLRNVYGFGAAGLAQRFQPQDSNLLTTFAYDPSGNTVARSVSSGTAAIGIGAPDDVALYDGYGYPVADVAAKTPGYVTATGPTSYAPGTVYSVGFGGQWGYYTENNTQLATSNVRDRGLLLATHRYYDPINARWLNRDPAGYDGGINLYGYVDGNPVMRFDPYGLDPVMWYDWLGRAGERLNRAAGASRWRVDPLNGDGIDMIVGFTGLIRDTGHLGEKSATGGAMGVAQDVWTGVQWPLMVIGMGGKTSEAVEVVKKAKKGKEFVFGHSDTAQLVFFKRMEPAIRARGNTPRFGTQDTVTDALRLFEKEIKGAEHFHFRTDNLHFLREDGITPTITGAEMIYLLKRRDLWGKVTMYPKGTY